MLYGEEMAKKIGVKRLKAYEEKPSYVSMILQYVSTLEIKEASPYVLQILQSDSEDFYDAALNAVGKIGGVEEAKYLVECLQDEDLPLARRQALMRALGQLKVVETYDDCVFDITGGENLILVAFGMLAGEFDTPMHQFNVREDRLIELDEGAKRRISRDVPEQNIVFTLDSFVELKGGVVNYSLQE